MRNCGGTDYVRSGVVTWAHTKLIILFIRLLIFPTENTPTINLQKRICEVFWVRKDWKRKEKEGKGRKISTVSVVIFWSIPWIYRHCWRCQAIITKQCKNSTRPELFCSTLVLVRCKSQFVFYIFSLYEKFPLIVRILILIIGFFGVIGTKNKLWREKSFFNMVDQKTKKNLHKFSVNVVLLFVGLFRFNRA